MDSFMFLGFGIDAWITIITLLGMFSTLLFTKLRSDLVFLIAIGILFITGVLDSKEAFSGFSAPSVVTIGVLFVVVAPFLIALMVSVSSSFATPIGSPTHMLVYGPGGYRFSDFMRIGLLMNIIILAANIFIVNIVYPLTPLQ